MPATDPFNKHLDNVRYLMSLMGLDKYPFEDIRYW